MPKITVILTPAERRFLQRVNYGVRALLAVPCFGIARLCVAIGEWILRGVPEEDRDNLDSLGRPS